MAEASRLIDLVQDARRFIGYYKWPIENAPLQVYSSALVFSPAHSLIRELFKQEEPEWITTKPAMQDDWTSCLQTLEGHSWGVTSVAFSHDDKRLASASSDNTVKVWDAASGKCLQTLEGHSDWVTSVAFSHDDKHLASASGDNTVKVWDAASSKCLQTLEVGRILRNISFDTTDQYLYTDIGSIILDVLSGSSTALSTTAYQKPRFQGYGLSSDGIWITCNSENLLWLPSEYRPWTSAVAASTMAIGCVSGRVLIFNLI